MTDLYEEYPRKSGNRDDPRLSRRDSKSSTATSEAHSLYDKLSIHHSPKRTTKSPVRDSHSERSWQRPPQVHNQYNNSTMQTAYQHLQPTVYPDHNQYATQGYSTSYNAYQQQGYATQQANTYNPYMEYNQGQPGYTTGSVQPGPPGEEYPHNEWAPAAGYQGVGQQVHHPSQMHMENDVKNEGVAQELKQQKAQMAKQREDYVRKVVVLRRELELLRNQKQELAQQSSEHDNNHILRENSKLQIEIQNKMKTIYNVVEMLTNIIGDCIGVGELEELYMDDSPKHRKEKSRRSISTEKVDFEAKFFYIYYDPELHWCRICDVFPKSAKEYLLHLHSKEHRQITQDRDMVDTPWHRLPPEPELPSFEGAAKKRMPIKGLQFLISATSWYCKLCDTWVGDLHCASQHLKSLNHNQNYSNFVEQNPHWEIEWIRDRDKALTRISKGNKSASEESDAQHSDNNKKRKDRHSPVDNKKDKRKKKPIKKRRKQSTESSSSSSSSDSSSDDEKNDTSKSIRVSMRNKMKLQAQMIMKEDLGGKWEVLGRLVEERKRKEAAESNKEAPPEDKLINQWMTINEPQEKDKRLFNDLKDRMKQKQDATKAKLAEIAQKRKDRERQEKEQREKKDKEEKAVREKEEAKRLQLEEIEKRKDKEREQIRFKTRDKNKRRSASQSPERTKSHSQKSPDRSRRDRSADRHHRDSRYHENGSHSSGRRRRSTSRDSRHSPRDKYKSESRARRPSAHKKPHFIGRMPLFKNKKQDEKNEIKEIKKEDYDIPRQSRFQPGNLAKSFIPEPDVVCFPKLSSIPPLTLPPPALVIPQLSVPEPQVFEPPLEIPSPVVDDSKLTQSVQLKEEVQESVPAPPPPPDDVKEEDEGLQPEQMMSPDFSQVYTDPNVMMQYQYNIDYNNMMYSHMYEYPQDMLTNDEIPSPPEEVLPEQEMPAPPPPLPPDDPNDLAMLGISADDMAAQIF